MARKKQVARKATGGAQGRKQIAAKRRLAVKMKRSQANSTTNFNSMPSWWESSPKHQPSKMVFAPNRPTKLPADMIIFVSGPCLHPEAMDPMSFQREALHTYFGQFGQITGISSGDGYTSSGDENTAKISFEKCDSVAKCLQQEKHKIGGYDFLVLAESNLGNELPQATGPSSSQDHGGAMDCSTNSGELPASHDLASFDKTELLDHVFFSRLHATNSPAPVSPLTVHLAGLFLPAGVVVSKLTGACDPCQPQSANDY
ncbi:hypothetical protein Ddc_15786 [Ditylenchus destructor]|nr:hypothetical protein Ddc_15786 [Ditylenchus destructor]